MIYSIYFLVLFSFLLGLIFNKNKIVSIFVFLALLISLSIPDVSSLIKEDIITAKKVNFINVKNEKELNKYISLAKENKKSVFGLFYKDTCDHCQKLERTTLASDKVIDLLNDNFINLIIDISEDSPELEILKKKFKIEGTPTYIFYNKDGEFDGSDYGYQGEEEFYETIEMTTD